MFDNKTRMYHRRSSISLLEYIKFLIKNLIVKNSIYDTKTLKVDNIKY